MKPLNLDAVDDDILYDVERIAWDSFYVDVEETPVFFFGQIIDEDLYSEEGCDEDKTYCRCPSCGSLFELDGVYESGGGIRCPHCELDGILADFRDRSMPLAEMNEQCYAYMEIYEDGYVLRLFKSYADYSNRDYDDYETLDYYPEMRFFEYGREYYHDGQLKYFVDMTEDGDFVEVETLYDDDFWLINSDDEIECLNDSPFFLDLKGDDDDKPLMHHLTKAFSYNAFRCVQKYGFKNIAGGMLFAANEFPDSSKISEVLGVDYNQIVANVGEDISIKELLAARKLYELGVCPTTQNIGLILDMNRIEKLKQFKLTTENARKTFKYLRNQQNKDKEKGKDIGRDFIDYLDECEKLDFDMSDSRVLYPTNLMKTHAHTSSLLKIKTNEETEIGVMKAYEKYNKLCSYDNGKFCVIVPKSCEDIILEGKLQSHCVGNYVERVAKGEDVILFVRRSSEKDNPFYTMEIRPIMSKLDIVQCRGHNNEDVSAEVRAEVDAFLAEYANWFCTRKSTVEEEKVKRIYYKAVKKIDGKYISAWDNKTEYIPGQLLETLTDKNPDRVAVKGIHIASLEFAQHYGDGWNNVAILELEVDVKDIVVPDAKDQIRTSRVKVLREVPFEEMGEWGAQRLARAAEKAA